MLTQMINGVEVVMSPEEEAATLAAWAAEDARRAADMAANGYKYARAEAYPSVVNQLDILFHEGFDGWKAAIQAVKDKFPKPAGG